MRDTDIEMAVSGVNDTDNNIKIRFGAQLEGDDEIKNPFEDDDFVGSDTLEQFTKTLK